MNYFTVLDSETAGTTMIPEPLASMDDQGLAQRLATSFYGTSPERIAKIEILHYISLNEGAGPHGVAFIKVHIKEDIYGDPYSYTALYCAHDLIHLPDNRFKNDEGVALISGLSSGQAVPCEAKKAAAVLRTNQVMSEYKEDEKLFKYHGTFLEPKAEEFILLDLITRAANDEWVGQDNSGAFYIQTAAKILDKTFKEVDRIANLLIAAGKIVRYGNILGPAPEGQSRPITPTRLWATHIEEFNNLGNYELKVFLPATYDEPQMFYAEFFKRGELHEITTYPFTTALSSDGTPEDKDVKILKRLLAAAFESIKGPILTNNELPLTFTSPLTPFKAIGFDKATPSDFYRTVELNEELAVSVFLPSSDNERHEALLISHPRGELITPENAKKENMIRVNLFYPLEFGLDVGDLQMIDIEINKLLQRVESSKNND